MTDTPDALLPCPFCDDPMEDRGYGAMHVNPGKCPIGAHSFPVITAWNTRSDTTQAARNAALEAEVGRLRSIGVKTMGLLHSNVHTKSRCDHDEQKLIVEWRAALTDPAP
jgi:hypothetical protein